MTTRTDLRFPSGDALCHGWLRLPDGEGRALVMAVAHEAADGVVADQGGCLRRPVPMEAR